MNLSRRKFFSVKQRSENFPLRPPWSLDETLFQESCTRCGDCLASCPEGILHREGPNGYPIVDFKSGECTFCQKCVDVCPSDALNLSETQIWPAKAYVKKQCLTLQGVICTTCAEQCELGVIRFTPSLGKISEPILNTDVCTGCGACVAPCPVQAIEVHV